MITKRRNALLRGPARYWPLVLSLLITGCGEHRDAGHLTAEIRDPDLQQEWSGMQRKQHPKQRLKNSHDYQILFGDLHVHTGFSPDALNVAMPIMGGDGLRNPADACDYARFCSALDFWSINDHAEGITPRRWQETKAAVRACNRVAGYSDNPDTVAFAGWEWSQVSQNRSEHFGHKNVIFPGIEDEELPARVIAAPRDQLGKAPMNRLLTTALGFMDWPNRKQYFDYQTYYQELADTPACHPSLPSPLLPENCMELAATPEKLFKKLEQWQLDYLVIPHGNSWGLNTPPGTSFDKQLNRRQHSPERQTLIESYSGHGNAEEYRPWRAIEISNQGSEVCPLPSGNYEPCCWRAGEIIRERCESESLSENECDERAAKARLDYASAGIAGHLTVPGQTVADWKNCGQCTDCVLPPMDHRPATSAQYALAIRNFDEQGKPLRFRFGMIGSSDNHRARGGVGYKEFGRFISTESTAPRVPVLERAFQDTREPLPYSIPLSEQADAPLNRLRNMERQNSFYYSGGLVAALADGRDRNAIWEALKARRVYATSGDRILLWFNQIDHQQAKPMGSVGQQKSTPHFEVHAVGAAQQLPGCPEQVTDVVSNDRLDELCRGECYNPGNARKPLARIEVVRIRPQQSPGEPVDALIEDPWRSFNCEGKSQCSARFSDPEYPQGQRDSIYYVRAVQQATPAINGGQLRCEYDDNGQCIDVNPCFADSRTDYDDDCLAPVEERAWSSPIFVDFPASD